MNQAAVWLEGIPGDWQRKRLKYVASLKSGDSITSEDIGESGEYPVFGGNGIRGYTSAYTHCGRHVLIGRQGALCGNINYAEGCFWASEHAVVAAVNADVDVTWLGELLRSMNLNQYSQSAAQPGLAVDVLANLEIPVPPLSRQHAIGDYLNREMTRLDALVVAKERVLTLLAEKRQALITCVVTRGIDSRVPLRDSGISWLGAIPAHWQTERARWLFRERDERSVTGEEELLSVSHLTGVTPRSEKDVNMFEAETTEGYKICHAGDLVINTLWAWMGAMGVSRVSGIVSPAYNVYRPGSRLEPSYVDALVRLPVFTQEVIRYSKGVWSSRLRLYPEGFFEVFLPVPSLPEQRDIVAYLARETRKLDELHTAVECTTALLKERRSALIAAAVTGQIDVEPAA
jgi:type I restriction enzyme, S subunit